ncbi:hypothetical protein LSM04_006066 [Trypanosoma melophagium]|uniref:uncharacterized protein n=1 Tax=Trypanosoma melophagium TaxID=715481 RepID=UPI00351A1DA4|nr:hypothetical protein LSM04_006066 [Trypanosoma melophagium]
MTVRRSRYALILLGVVYLIVIFALLYDDTAKKTAIVVPHGEPRIELAYRNTGNLIMVPGHGVLGALSVSDWRNENNWGLEPHQLRDGVSLPLCFASHIRRGLQILKEDVNASLLIFSGGQTRDGSGPRSEGLSYYLVAEETELFGLFDSVVERKYVLQNRIFAEEFARDSYENLLFSIARFYEVTGRFPERIIVVGWKHKEKRFSTYHREAIRFPRSKFTYIGLNFEDAGVFVQNLEPYRKALPYSDAHALALVTEDMYLCNSGKRTRAKRNPQFRVPPYELSCPPLRPLLRYCGPYLIDRKLVPWG